MGKSVADVIVALACERFEFFHDPSGGTWAYADRETYRIGSGEFRELLAHDLFEQAGRKVAPTSSLTNAENTLRGLARWEGKERDVALRIARDGARVVLDLADADRTVAIVDGNGWSLTTDSPVRFHRPSGTRGLLLPVRGGSLDACEALWPLDEDGLTLVLGWLLGCFNPTGPKPLLDLSGVQGSGKTGLGRMVADLFDPNAGGLQTLPALIRDLAVMAKHHALLAFDNVSLVPDELSDAFCRLATGGGFQTRKLYTDDDVVTFTATRPVMLTGIPDVARQPDLVERTITVTIAEMPEYGRRREVEVLAEFEAARPELLGVILDAVAMALANVDRMVLPSAPRMLDFVTWVEAGAPAFGWEPGRFLDAYVAAQRRATSSVIDGSVVGRFVRHLARESFEGTLDECFVRLEKIAWAESATRQRGWPATPRGLAGSLRRLTPALRQEGVVVEFSEEDGRSLVRIFRPPSGPVLAFDRRDVS